jgi:hypothetical protein
MRIRLDYTSDSHTKLRAGELGTITGRHTDPWGAEIVRVTWDSGSTLSLISGEDSWSVVAETDETPVN